MPRAYFNENDRNAAQWLRNLVAAGLLPDADVDERSIEDVTAADLADYDQCHFFAGIGIWALALQWAGWGSRPVWTGSCPCQPFSAAGQGAGFADERHLWPAWFHLIEQRGPGAIFGEQVASPDGLAWFDLVSADMEACGYTCGPVDFPSAGIGAPNIRQRLWWVADAGFNRQNVKQRVLRQQEVPRIGRDKPQYSSATLRVGDTSDARLPHAEPQDLRGTQRDEEGRTIEQSRCPPNPWRELEWLDCRDGKRRPTKSGLFPLAPRNPGGVGILRASGNAINPYVAAEVIRAAMHCLGIES